MIPRPSLEPAVGGSVLAITAQRDEARPPPIAAIHENINATARAIDSTAWANASTSPHGDQAPTSPSGRPPDAEAIHRVSGVGAGLAMASGAGLAVGSGTGFGMAFAAGFGVTFGVAFGFGAGAMPEPLGESMNTMTP